MNPEFDRQYESTVREEIEVFRRKAEAFLAGEIPEVDRAAWYGLDEAREKIVAAQQRFLFDLEAKVAAARR